MDLAPLNALFGHPTTRPWLSYARVLRTYIDEANLALWIEARVEETGMLLTARMASLYGGPGAGLYAPPAVDAEVLVAFPSQGVQTNSGEVEPDLTAGVVLAVLQDDACQPGKGEDAPQFGTLLLTLMPGHKLVVRTAGPGAATINVDTEADSVTVVARQIVIGDGTGTVKLAGGLMPIARVGDAVQAGPFYGTIVGPGNPLVLG